MSKKYISKEDIHHLFYKEKRRFLFPSWQVVSAGIIIVAGVYFLLNAPAVNKQVQFWWENDILAAKQVETVKTPSVTQPVTSRQPSQTAATPNVTKSQTVNPQTIADNSIWIPRIKTKAPVIWDVTGGADLNTDMLNALRYGVVRYPQTALPDQIGNVFLTGHSSNYWWEKGQYKTVFALLDKLIVGDLIYVKYKGTLYTYKVASQRVVSPSETSVLAPSVKPILRLMTCTPTGTTLNRRIVTADLVEPKELTQKQPTSPSIQDLEGVR